MAFRKIKTTNARCLMSMCTVLHAIVAAALSHLAGLSVLAAPLLRWAEDRNEAGPAVGSAHVGRGSTDGVRLADRARAQPARRCDVCFFWERSRLSCRHRTTPFLCASKPDRSDGPHLVDGRQRSSQSKTCIVRNVHVSLRHRHLRAVPPRRSVSPRSAPVHASIRGPGTPTGRSISAWDAPRQGLLSHRSRTITRRAGIGAALGVVPALTLPSQIAKACARLGSTTACKSRSLTPTRLISFCAILAAHVLLRTPCALAVTPLTDGNIRTAATAWIDNRAAATTTYGAASGTSAPSPTWRRCSARSRRSTQTSASGTLHP